MRQSANVAPAISKIKKRDDGIVSTSHTVLCAHFGQVAVPIASGDAAIHEEVAPGDEPSVRPHEQRSHCCHLVRSAGPPRRRSPK